MIGSFRLPTHSRDAHRKFFDRKIKIESFAKRYHMGTLGGKGLRWLGSSLGLDSSLSLMTGQAEERNFPVRCF